MILALDKQTVPCVGYGYHSPFHERLSQPPIPSRDMDDYSLQKKIRQWIDFLASIGANLCHYGEREA